MTPQTTHTVFFSPTGSSRKIARAIAQGLSSSGQVAVADVTHKAAPETTFGPDAAVVFVVPVYGGKVAPTALARMENLRGEGTPAVVAVVYGNRDIGQAAAQLAAFGAKVRQKLASGPAEIIDAAKLRAPRTPLLPLLRFIAFVIRYRRNQQKNPVVLLPATDAGLCIHCGRCAAICPTTAIARGAEERTDPARCIRCCACVKICPVTARSFATPFSAALARNFSRRKPTVTLL